jgi:hypothetical protein
VQARQAVWFHSDEELRKLTRWCGAVAALGWVILEVSFEVLLGPHVLLMRSLTIGCAIGAFVGLLTSTLQWIVLRDHVRYSGALIPAITAASTLSGMVCGLLLYSLSHNVPLYGWTIPLQGAVGAVFVGLVSAQAQWVVLRSRTGHGEGWGRWVTPTIAGTLLGAAFTCSTSLGVIMILTPIRARLGWPYILIVANLTAGIVGGAFYGRVITRGLRQLFVGPRAPLYVVEEPNRDGLQALDQA